MPSWLRVILILAALWILVCVGAFLLQRRLQYFPDRSEVRLPPGADEAGLEAVSFTAADGVRLQATYLGGTRETAVLLFHGNAGNRGDRLSWMQDLQERGWPILLLDYRGYGGSEGSPSETGFRHDAEAAHAWLVERGHERIVYLGSSIGCGVAVGLAATHPPVGLVLQSGAVDLLPIAKRGYPFLPMGLIFRDRFDVREAAGRVTAPALCIHGDLDRVIPVGSGRALHDALGGEKTWWEVEGAGHNDVVALTGVAWFERVHAFLGSVDTVSPPPAR